MDNYSDITKLDWEILDALSDDYESIEQIQQMIGEFSGMSATQFEILDRMEYLHENHYVFLILNRTFDRAKMEDEVFGRTADRHYWFGRTETGYLAWGKLTDKYAGGKERGKAANNDKG